MNLYRTFKTFLYWFIPSSYISQNIEEFDTSTDLVTIYKDLPDTGAYQNRKVSMDLLKSLLDVPVFDYYELSLYATGAGATTAGESPTFYSFQSNTFPAANFIVSFDTVNNGIKIQDDNLNNYFSELEGSTQGYLNGYFVGFTNPTDGNTNKASVEVYYQGPNTITLKCAGSTNLEYDFDYLSCTIRIEGK